MPADTAPTLDTTKVTGRRSVRYESFDDLLADAERLAAGEVRTLGNWSYGQILDHLAKSINAMIDGPGFPPMPLPVRFLLRLLMKKKMVYQGMSPGFKFPGSVAKTFAPDDIPVAEGIQLLKTAAARVPTTSERILHGAFGKITTEEWDQFQLRHCEMHMSFVQPG